LLCRVERNLLKINEKSSTDFEKKKKRWEKKLEKEKHIFVKFAPKRSAPK